MQSLFKQIENSKILISSYNLWGVPEKYLARVVVESWISFNNEINNEMVIFIIGAIKV